MSAASHGRGACFPVLLVAVAMLGACGAGGAGPSSDRACAFDGPARTVRMRSGSSHAHIWRDLTVDLAAGRLTGQVSTSVGGQPHVVDVDHAVDEAALVALRARLAEACGAVSTADEPPDDVAGGSTSLTIESPTHGRLAVVGAGLTSTVPAGTRALEVTRAAFLAVVDAFPEPRVEAPQ